ncbi:alpha/beta hydrolase [Streptomyces sp. NPDC058612]|uniref:alpha/beta hydrolase n=1 Tax=Streptomyces sp. NPDC058612 TaxID=3346555 RepID=UPI00365AE377
MLLVIDASSMIGSYTERFTVPVIQGNAALVAETVVGQEDCSLLVYDPGFKKGRGRAAVAVGPMETAEYVAVLVPGMGSSLESLGELVGHARQLRKQCLRTRPCARVAVVAWAGYKAPQNLPRAAREEPASAGSELLLGDLNTWRGHWRKSAVRNGLEMPAYPSLTVSGLSYGSVVAGHAAANAGSDTAGKPVVDSLVLLGSPGTGLRARHLGDSRIFVSATDTDLVSMLEWFSIDPSHKNYGENVTRMKADYQWTLAAGLVENATKAHTSYYNPGTESLANIARVVVGKPQEVSQEGQRTRAALGGHRNMIGRAFTKPPEKGKSRVRRAAKAPRLPQVRELDVDAVKGGIKAVANSLEDSTSTEKRKKGLEILADSTIPWYGESSGFIEAIEEQNAPEAFYQISKAMILPIGIAVPWVGWGLAVFDILKEQITNRVIAYLNKQETAAKYDAAGVTTIELLTRTMEHEITQAALLELEQRGHLATFAKDAGRKLENIGWLFAKQMSQLEMELWYRFLRAVDGVKTLNSRQLEFFNHRRMPRTDAAYRQAMSDIRQMVTRAKGLATCAVPLSELGQYGIPLPYPTLLEDTRPGFFTEERFVIPHPTEPGRALEVYNNERVYRLEQRSYDRSDLIPGVDLPGAWERVGEEIQLRQRLDGAKAPYPARTRWMAVPRAAYSHGGKMYGIHQKIDWTGGTNRWTGGWTVTEYRGPDLSNAVEVRLAKEVEDALDQFLITNMYVAPDTGHIVYIESEWKYLKVDMANGRLLKQGRLDDPIDEETPANLRREIRTALGAEVTVGRVVNGSPSEPLQELNITYSSSRPCTEESGNMRFARYSMREGRMLLSRNSPVSKPASLTVKKIEILGHEDANGDETMGEITIGARNGGDLEWHTLWSTRSGEYMTDMKGPYTLGANGKWIRSATSEFHLYMRLDDFDHGGFFQFRSPHDPLFRVDQKIPSSPGEHTIQVKGESGITHGKRAAKITYYVTNGNV